MKKLLLLILLLTLLAVPVTGLILLYHVPFDTADPSPTQPIAFSHQLHAGEYEISCRFCHRHVATGQVAGVPDLALCYSCHQYIGRDKPAVQQLHEYWTQRKTIPWIRVHQLPDHVYFPHMMHVRAEVACTTCHGEVSQMKQLARQTSLKMGWCLDCHREHKASIDCWTCHI